MNKKVMSLVLALASCAAMSTTAFAATGYGSSPSDTVYVPEVTVSDIADKAESTIQGAVNSGSSTATVKVNNANSITTEALKAVAEAARSSGVTAVVHADKIVGNVVQSRFYIDPAKAAALSGTIDLSVSTDNAAVQQTAALFEKYFSNPVSVINLGQKGAYGMDMPLALQVDLSKLDTSKLTFFSFDPATNKYVTIQNPKYFIDRNGYLHFTTPVGGNIVIADQPTMTAK